MGHETGKKSMERRLIIAIDKYQLLGFLTDAAENLDKYGVHPKHQIQLKHGIKLLVEHLK